MLAAIYEQTKWKHAISLYVNITYRAVPRSYSVEKKNFPN